MHDSDLPEHTSVGDVLQAMAVDPADALAVQSVGAIAQALHLAAVADRW
jgi:hypothetical protein